MKYLKDFIIGSSLPVSIIFLYGFYNLKRQNYTYFYYSLLAPLWFGLWNIISLIIADKFKLSKKYRFLLISLLTYGIIITYVTYNNVYNFTKIQWYLYYIGMLLAYLFIWNVIIFNLDKYIK